MGVSVHNVKWGSVCIKHYLTEDEKEETRDEWHEASESNTKGQFIM